MRCCGKLESLFFIVAMWCAVFSAQAADIVAHSAQLSAGDDGYILSANFSVNLNPRLEEAVNRGIVLYFTADFELTRKRWYWFDEQVVRRSKTFQLSYHALTRQYRLSSGALHQSFGTLEEALRILSRVRYWQVLEKDEVRETAYLASVRLRLDPSQMPKTFQVSALSNRAWNQSSDWFRWTFTVPETPPSAAPADPGTGEGK